MALQPVPRRGDESGSGSEGGRDVSGQTDSDPEEDVSVKLTVTLNSQALTGLDSLSTGGAPVSQKGPLASAAGAKAAKPPDLSNNSAGSHTKIPELHDGHQLRASSAQEAKTDTPVPDMAGRIAELERKNQDLQRRNQDLQQNVYDAAHFGQELLNRKVELEKEVARLQQVAPAGSDEANQRKRATQLAAEFDKERAAHLEEKSKLLAKIKTLEEEKRDFSVARISTLRKSLVNDINGREQSLDVQLELAEERARSAELREALEASKSEQEDLVRKLKEHKAHGNTRPGARLNSIDKELLGHVVESDEYSFSWFGRLSDEVQTLREKLADQQEAELRHQACDAERLALKQRLENVKLAESAMQQRLLAMQKTELFEVRKVMEVEMYRTLLQIQGLDVGRFFR